jgi:hypothetical protein
LKASLNSGTNLKVIEDDSKYTDEPTGGYHGSYNEYKTHDQSRETDRLMEMSVEGQGHHRQKIALKG